MNSRHRTHHPRRRLDRSSVDDTRGLALPRKLCDLAGAAPYARVAELHFPSIAALQSAAASSAAQKAVAHAISISNGGTPIFLVAEEEVKSFPAV
jgi:hypothetical protein